MKILLPIPRGASPARSLDLALEVALRHGGEILARFVVDREGIGRQEAGYGAVAEKVLGGPKLEAFESFLAEVDADVAVLGGLGAHRWDEPVGRSVTGRLIADDRRHLFLFM